MYTSLLSPHTGVPSSLPAVVPPLRRRRPRSVEQDVQRLTTLRESLAIARAHFSNLLEEERLGRVELEQAHDSWWSAMAVTEKRRRNYAKFCEGDVYTAQAGRHEVTRKMEATVRKSREVEKMRRKALLDVSHAFKKMIGHRVANEAGEWKETFRNKTATWRALRHDVVAERREQQRQRLLAALESLDSEHRSNRERRRADREANEAQLSTANMQQLQKAHQRVARVRAEADGSPMRLLKLDPLTFTLPHRGRSSRFGMTSTSVSVASILRNEDSIAPLVDQHVPPPDTATLMTPADEGDDKSEAKMSVDVSSEGEDVSLSHDE